MLKKYFRKIRLPLVIAEIGLNHNGDVNLAKKSIKAAHLAGADLVKIQTFKAISLCSEKSKYYDFFKKCELNEKQLVNLFKFSSKLNINLFSTVFDEWSANIISAFKPPFIKISSGDISHIPLITCVAKKNIPIILSTGASNINDIKTATHAIKKSNRNLEYYLLHCVSNYPTDPKSTNLLCLEDLRKKFKVPIGFSDHTTSNETSLIATALGAEIIEKHFTLDKKLPGPDHALSADPKEFKNFVKSVKLVNEIKGKNKKTLVEGKSLAKAIRRSIFAKRTIKSGSIIKIDDIKISRPVIGIEPKYMNKIIGKKIIKTIPKEAAIKWSYIKNK